MTDNEPLYAVGDPVFVYRGPGLVTRLDGWALSVLERVFGNGAETTRNRRVVVFRDTEGRLDTASPMIVTPLDMAAGAWHMVAPAAG